MSKSLQQDQRGLGHPLLILFVLIVVAALVAVGWQVKRHNDNNTSGGSTCMSAYHDQQLCDFATANANLSKLAYTAVDNSTVQQGGSAIATQITVKSDGQGNTSVSSVNGTQTFNSVTIGSTVYVQSNGSPWVSYPSNAPKTVNPITGLKLQFNNGNTTTDTKTVKYKKIGTEQCSGQPCVKYQVLNPDWAGTNYIWINTETSRLVRWTGSSSDGTNDVTITYGPVTITAPAGAINAADATPQQLQAITQVQQP